MNLLDSLNENQKEAVITTDGPLLVLAGAGSGKTRVIIHRIAYLIKERMVPPYKIFAVTFTNKAAGEMKKRIIDLIGPLGEQVFIKTFHSASVFILRRYGDAIGIPSSFSIYDSKDQESVIKEMLIERKLDPKKNKPSIIASKISELKDKIEIDGADPDLLCDRHFPFKFGEFYNDYANRLTSRNALDFNDLLIKTVLLIKNNPEVKEKLQNKWPYLMIDEYQDTNSAQYLMTRFLAEKTKNICVVGDDDQSIYSWRGADITNILNFEKDYPEAKTVKLEENYRSTKPILDVAYAVIQNNRERTGKSIISKRIDGEMPVWCNANNEYAEAEFVINKISTLKSQERLSNKDFAIFYRTNAQSRIFEDQLRKENIPYRIIGGTKFYDRKEIKDITSYLKFISNPFDTVSLLRIINNPTRGLGAKTIENLKNQAYINRMSEWEIIDKEIPINGKIPKGFSTFKKIILKGMIINSEIPVKNKLSTLVNEILESSGYKHALEEENTIESKTRIENINEFVNSIFDYENNNPEATLDQFLQEISLLTSEENPQADENMDPNNVVTLMTVHNAKGLEFTAVFLTGMEENIFPHINSMGNESEIEEERRLCYVGITRAKERLFISNAELRRNFSGMVSNQASRFIFEIPENLIEMTTYNSNDSFSGGYSTRSTIKHQPANSSGFGQPGFGQSGYNKNTNSLPKTNPYFDSIKNSDEANKFFENISNKTGIKQTYKIKDRVMHPKYGKGSIIFIEGKSDNTKLTIHFDSAGVKSFLEKYTPLEKA